MKGSRFDARNVMKQDIWKEIAQTLFPQQLEEGNGLGKQRPWAPKKLIWTQIQTKILSGRRAQNNHWINRKEQEQ